MFYCIIFLGIDVFKTFLIRSNIAHLYPKMMIRFDEVNFSDCCKEMALVNIVFS